MLCALCLHILKKKWDQQLCLYFTSFNTSFKYPKFVTSHFLQHRTNTAVSVHAMDACEEMDVDIHAFLTSALDGGEWLASHPGCYTSKDRGPHTQ
jgi:hypothetical protein